MRALVGLLALTVPVAEAASAISYLKPGLKTQFWEDNDSLVKQVQEMRRVDKIIAEKGVPPPPDLVSVSTGAYKKIPGPPGSDRTAVNAFAKKLAFGNVIVATAGCVALSSRAAKAAPA